jgi:hypothetical protein
MPLPPYLLLHPEAKLSDADKAVLRAWSQTFGASSEEEGEDAGHEE